MKKILLLATIAVLILTSCDITGSPEDMKEHLKITPDGIVYETFYIEGMPCMRIGRGISDEVFEYDGVTCDWSKWEGGK